MEKLQGILAAEYPALEVAPIGNEIGKLDRFVTSWTDGADEDRVIVLTTKKVPEIADIFAACDDMDLDPEALEAEEEDRTSSSIVPEHFRKLYRENSSTGRSNGDWLAERLATDTLGAKDKFIVEYFTQVLENNGVDLSGKWAQARFNLANGGSGRYRMNGRQVMEKTVAKQGVYFDALQVEHEVPADFLATLRSKHAKWLEKEAKKDAAAEAAIKETVEG